MGISFALPYSRHYQLKIYLSIPLTIYFGNETIHLVIRFSSTLGGFMNIATSCECGWVGIGTTYADSAALHLSHQVRRGDGHSSLTRTNVKEVLGNPELSIIRQVASQDALDYRAKQRVVSREDFRLRRAGDMMAPMYVTDDGLGCARGCWTAIKIYGALIMLAAFTYCSWRMLCR